MMTDFCGWSVKLFRSSLRRQSAKEFARKIRLETPAPSREPQRERRVEKNESPAGLRQARSALALHKPQCSNFRLHEANSRFPRFPILNRNTKVSIANMSDNEEIEVEAVSGYQVLPKEVTDEIGSIKLFNKWSYEDVEIRDISLT